MVFSLFVHIFLSLVSQWISVSSACALSSRLANGRVGLTVNSLSVPNHLVNSPPEYVWFQQNYCTVHTTTAVLTDWMTIWLSWIIKSQYALQKSKMGKRIRAGWKSPRPQNPTRVKKITHRLRKQRSPAVFEAPVCAIAHTRIIQQWWREWLIFLFRWLLLL